MFKNSIQMGLIHLGFPSAVGKSMTDINTLDKDYTITKK